MARPHKTGLDYFPVDVTMENNLELFEAEHGLIGFALIIKLWQEIYKNGYYLTYDDDTILLLSKKFGVTGQELRKVINTAARRNLFSKQMLKEQSVLTSTGIQRRYLRITGLSRRVNANILPSLLLLTPEETELTRGESTQRKEKESKEKKSTPINNDSFKRNTPADIYKQLKPIKK
jgi:hypothetical protein